MATRSPSCSGRPRSISVLSPPSAATVAATAAFASRWTDRRRHVRGGRARGELAGRTVGEGDRDHVAHSPPESTSGPSSPEVRSPRRRTRRASRRPLLDERLDGRGGVVREEVGDPHEAAAPVAIGGDLHRGVVVGRTRHRRRCRRAAAGRRRRRRSPRGRCQPSANVTSAGIAVELGRGQHAGHEPHVGGAEVTDGVPDGRRVGSHGDVTTNGCHDDQPEASRDGRVNPFCP